MFMTVGPEIPPDFLDLSFGLAIGCGWYPEDKLTDTPRRRRNPRQTLEMNWGPLSETMSSGRPKFLNMCWKRDSAVSRADGNPRSGINLQDLENRSTTTRMVVNPFEGGRSVAKSTPRWDQGRWGMGKGTSFPSGRRRGVEEMAQIEHPLT